MGEQMYECTSGDGRSYVGTRYGKLPHIPYHRALHKCGKGLTWGGTFRNVIRRLDCATSLQYFHLVLPLDWQLQRYTEDSAMDLWGDRALDPDHEEVWKILYEFKQARPSLKIKVVQPIETQIDLILDEFNQKRHIKNLKQRLGLWDHRVAWIPDWGYWSIEKSSEEDPGEYLEYLCVLFA